MKALITTTLTFLAISTAYAGPISSGGTNQNVETCANANKSVTLKVEVVNNDHLEAELTDSSSGTTTSIVHRVEDGYKGQNMKIVIEYAQGNKIATAVVLSEDPRMEPRVYPNLICSEFLK